MKRLCEVVAVVVIASSVLAQSEEEPANLYANADVVFTGRVASIEQGLGGPSVSFAIDDRIKGVSNELKTLNAGVPTETRCHKFEENHSYLVYGRRVGDAVVADPCEGSKLISQAEKDLRYIHTVDPKVSEKCSRKNLRALARKSPVIVTAEVIGTQDTVGNSPLQVGIWCGHTL